MTVMYTAPMIDRRTFVRLLACLSTALALDACQDEHANTTVQDMQNGNSLHVPTPELGYYGRWFRKEVNGSICAVSTAPGAYYACEIEGVREISAAFEPMELSEEIYWAYQIDRQQPVRQPISSRHIELPDTSHHEVKVIFDSTDEFANRWEGEQGIAFAGVDAKGGITAPVLPKRPVIAFYGDSITEGDCVLAAHTSPAHNSATHGFAWLLAEMLDMDAYFAGYGSTGITNTGSFAPAEQAIASLSKSRTAQAPNASLVVVEYGTNDKEADTDAFAEGYAHVLETLRDMHVVAPICCITPFDQTHASTIVSVIDALGANAKMGDLFYVDASNWNLSYTDGVHPDEQSSAVIAQHLFDELRQRYPNIP